MPYVGELNTDSSVTRLSSKPTGRFSVPTDHAGLVVVVAAVAINAPAVADDDDAKKDRRFIIRTLR
jgi:hypothetical protein